MNDMEMRREKVSLAVSIGEEMLKNGGEVYRVEDTIKRILNYFELNNNNVYIVSNGIFVTVDEQEETAVSCVRNVPAWSINLGNIADLNKLSREICEGRYSVQEAYERFNEISAPKDGKYIQQVLATSIGSAAFCFLYGGEGLDVVVALVAGFLLRIFLEASKKRNVSKFIRHIIGSMIITVITIGMYVLLPQLRVDKVIIGSIMILVPGVAFTTGIRDFFGGDYLSGSIHLIDAILTAVCIATGVGVSMKIFMLLGVL